MVKEEEEMQNYIQKRTLLWIDLYFTQIRHSPRVAVLLDGFPLGVAPPGVVARAGGRAHARAALAVAHVAGRAHAAGLARVVVVGQGGVGEGGVEVHVLE